MIEIIDPSEIEKNLIAFYRMNGQISGADIVEGEHNYIIENGPNGWPNFILNKNVGQENLALRLKELERINPKVKNYIFNQDEAIRHKNLLKNHQLVPVKAWVAMALNLEKKYEEESLDGFDTVIIHTEDQLTKFMTLVNQCLYKQEILTLKSFSAVLRDKNCCLVVGIVNGEVVSTAMSYQNGSYTGIYYITTKVGFRKKGYGMATTAALMNTQYERGNQQFVLHATPEGLSIYKKMGFASHGKLNIFTKVK